MGTGAPASSAGCCPYRVRLSSSLSFITTTAAVGADGIVQMGDQYQIVLTSTDLPPAVQPGMVVESLMRSRARGVVSLHVMPVDATVARKILDRRLALQRYTAREGNDGVDNQIALSDTAETLA